jgi:uncharacterized protein YbaA (DUF1428 family)
VPRYVDSFVSPIPKKNVDAYRKIARRAGRGWREHGALEYKECIAEHVKKGVLTSFPRSVKLRKDEIVFFSWIVFKSRAHCDRVNAKGMKDPRIGMGTDPASVPFDAKRMLYGGFEIAVAP